NACLDQVANEASLASQSEKQKLYRRCLQTIDAELAQRKAQADEAKAQELAAQAEQNQQEQESWVSADEQIRRCKFIQSNVISLEKDRIRAYARSMAARSPDDQQRTQKAYQDIIDELDRLIPPELRFGQALVPETVDRFKRCDPEEFESLEERARNNSAG
ncbi:MAG: hypothetical protein ACO3FK_09425, partial [Vulcanococcus sp.]